MPVNVDGSFIIGRMLEDRREIKNGKTYILLTGSEGIVYKRVINKYEDMLTLISDNTFYVPYDVRHTDIIELWEFACSIDLKDNMFEDVDNVEIKKMFLQIKGDLSQIIEFNKKKDRS